MRRYRFHGFQVCIDRPKYNYGHFHGVRARDRGYLDVFVGPKLSAKRIYVVVQDRKKKPKEVKVFIGFSSWAKAKKRYLEKYSRKSLGRKATLSVKSFLEYIRERKFLQ